MHIKIDTDSKTFSKITGTEGWIRELDIGKAFPAQSDKKKLALEVCCDYWETLAKEKMAELSETKQIFVDSGYIMIGLLGDRIFGSLTVLSVGKFITTPRTRFNLVQSPKVSP